MKVEVYEDEKILVSKNPDYDRYVSDCRGNGATRKRIFDNTNFQQKNKTKEDSFDIFI